MGPSAGRRLRTRADLADLDPAGACEFLFPSTARRDLGEKARLHHRHQVPWTWTVDPVAGRLRPCG